MHASRPANGAAPSLDVRVHQLEDARQRARQSPSFAMGSLSLSTTMPARPGYGNEGTPINIFTNYVTLTPKPDLVLYVYDMSECRFSPAMESAQPFDSKA